MDVKMEVFLSVVQHGNFSRAAEELNMSQPAVSQQIKSLENELGVKLLDRNTKMVSPTRAGEIVHHYGQQISAFYGMMQRTLDDLRELITGSLIVGASYTFGEYILPHIMADFCRSHLEVRPTIHISNTENVAEMVNMNAIDIGVVEGEVDLPGISVCELMSDRMVIIASPQYFCKQAGKVDIQELSSVTWVLRERGSGTRTAADSLLKTAGIEPAFVMEFSSTQAIKESVAAGLGLSILSELTVQEEIQQHKICQIPLEQLQVDSMRKFYLLQREVGFEPKVVEAFREFLILAAGQPE